MIKGLEILSGSFGIFNHFLYSEQNNPESITNKNGREINWNELVDTTRWIPFRHLPYCGMKLDSIKKILGEPDFVSGCKMTYGLDKYGGQGCDIAPMFENDSCAIVYEYIWQPTKSRIQTILFLNIQIRIQRSILLCGGLRLI